MKIHLFGTARNNSGRIDAMYPYGLVGNCQISALISDHGSIDWLCLPRPDSPPVFGKILDPEGGAFSVECEGVKSHQQSYLPNTTVLVTTITDNNGHQFKVTDFCPRFYQHGRMYRPIALYRIVEPLVGSPNIKILCRPVNGWEKEAVRPIRGNSHLNFEIRSESLRLTTNAPLTYLCDEISFAIKEPIYLALTWGVGIEEDLSSVTNRFLEQTIGYWNTWVKHCSIPSLYQSETIRSALTLKLHCYEDTGAILAALTTSLPEDPGKGRNWDYRFCWLRDSYFVLSAFHKLGHFEEMEGFITYLLNIAERHEHSRERLWPVYQLDQSLPLPEIERLNWQGYQSSRPVRTNNQAAEHIQNDVYGEMILTFAPIFFDERFHHLRTPDHERLMAHLAKLCADSISKPDAGLWELRNGWQEHSFSNLMCWAGLDRTQKIRGRGFLSNMTFDLPAAIKRAENAIYQSVKEGSLRNGPKDDSFDSALLQIATLSFNDSELIRKTIERIQIELRLGEGSGSSSFLYRYRRNDDFGQPNSSFIICSFWLVQALCRSGQLERAMSVMNDVMIAANQLGLFSEHYLPSKRQQAGNFPQAYSHVGQINAAFEISPKWNEVL